MASETFPSGEEVITLYKPALIANPENNKTGFLTNYSREIPGLHSYLNKLFHKDYKGWKWAYHKLAWKHPFFMRITHFKLSEFVNYLKLGILSRLKKPADKAQTTTPIAQPTPKKLASAFNPDEMRFLAGSMHKHFSCFKWKKGDLLIVDNLQLAHGGMPGFGSRVIRALLCNPIKVGLSPASPGHQPAREHVGLSEILETSAGI